VLAAAAIGSLVGYYVFNGYLKDTATRRDFEQKFASRKRDGMRIRDNQAHIATAAGTKSRDEIVHGISDTNKGNGADDAGRM